MNWNAEYGFLLLFGTVVTYVGALLIEKIRKDSGEKSNKKARICLVVCLITNLGLLAFFKYSGFAIGIANKILGVLHIQKSIPTSWVDYIILPVGISFYILQSLGYLIDVYRKDVYAEKNFFRYALFISFFPQLVAGPIERSKNLLTQLAKPQKLSWDNCKRGFFIMLWGYFLKLVIADRAAIFVNKVYGDSSTYPGFYIVLATVLFAIQIYCDFCGYSTIARGVALFFGIRLVDNFKAPYFSRSIEEFWRRWHISLSGWFRDYLYIPLGGNRKGIVRKQINKLIVFSVSGLWHGASLAYILWGMLNGIYQVISDCWRYLTEKVGVLAKFNKKTDMDRTTLFSRSLLRCAVTFMLVCFTWFFFRAGDLSDAIEILQNLKCFNWEILFDGSLYNLGISKEFFHVLVLSIGILFLVDYQKYREKDVAQILMQQDWWFQGIIVLVMIYGILLFGCYGVEYDTNQFIYFQF